MIRAVFLDKDGTLIPDIPYNVDPNQIDLYPETGSALQTLKKAGYQLFVVSNQAGVARGYFPEEALEAVFSRITDLLSPFAVQIGAYYYCPNHPNGIVDRYAIDCNNRKPNPGMLLEAAQQHGIDLTQSWMIGDILNDVEAGNRAGCRTILVDRGNETNWLPGSHRTPFAIVQDLAQAANLLVEVTQPDYERQSSDSTSG